MSSPLAIHGGPRAVPEGAIRPSPPTTSLDEQMVLASLRSGQHAWGENCEALQTEWAAWNGNRHCVALTSGTAALHMCLAACGLSAGDEVITPAYSWTSSASCILHHHCIPVFVDIEPRFANLDPAKIEAAITPRTKAILIVHLHGVPADIDAIVEIARGHGLAVIEDACQAHGALYRGRKVGTIGRCAAFSLNQNKMLSAGEGGLFVTDDEALLERGRALVLFGDFGKPLPDPEYHAYGLGYMYRYNDLCAAYARAQLRQLDANIAHARGLFAILREELARVPGLLLPAEPEYGTENGYNFVCHVDPEAVGYRGPVNFFREAIVRALAAEGVPALVWQRRILPEYAAIAARNAFGNGSPWREHHSPIDYDPGRFPVALYHSASYFILNGLRLPNTEETAGLIAAGVRKVFENLAHLDIDLVAGDADVSLYERGWSGQAVSMALDGAKGGVMVVKGLKLPPSFVHAVDKHICWTPRDGARPYRNLWSGILQLCRSPPGIVNSTAELQKWYPQKAQRFAHGSDIWSIDPGFIPYVTDFSQVVQFGDEGLTSPLCFDFRENHERPDIIYWTGVYWRRIAPDFDSFIAQFEPLEWRREETKPLEWWTKEPAADSLVAALSEAANYDIWGGRASVLLHSVYSASNQPTAVILPVWNVPATPTEAQPDWAVLATASDAQGAEPRVTTRGSLLALEPGDPKAMLGQAVLALIKRDVWLAGGMETPSIFWVTRIEPPASGASYMIHWTLAPLGDIVDAHAVFFASDDQKLLRRI